MRIHLNIIVHVILFKIFQTGYLIFKITHLKCSYVIDRPTQSFGKQYQTYICTFMKLQRLAANSTEQISYTESDSHLAFQENPRFLRNQKNTTFITINCWTQSYAGVIQSIHSNRKIFT